MQDLITSPIDETMAARLNLTGAVSELDTATVERVLMQALLSDLAIILRPLTGAAREFFSFWARRFELFNLKALIRGKLRNLPEVEVERHLQDMPSFTILDHEKLLRTEGVAELLRQIEASPYGDIARQARQVLEDKQETLAVEAAIDQTYFTGLIKRAHRLPKVDQDAMHGLMGVQIDRINLSWLVRFRFAYRLSPSETYYYLIRHGYYLRRDDRLRLVELEHCDDVVQALPSLLRMRLEGARDPLDFERRLEHLVIDRARATVRDNAPALTKALAYLLLRECELHRLFAIFQGRRLGIDEELVHAAVGDGVMELH